jgi:hypothetical protein
MSLREALDRTLLLMRDEVDDSVDDDTLLAALTGTRVALIADAGNITSHSAQTAFITAAMLMARSGHQVHLLCPEVVLAGAQPPLSQGRMIDQLVRIGADLLPGVQFSTQLPDAEIDLAIALGDSEIGILARQRISLNAGSWSGELAPSDRAVPWKACSWPFGGMAAAALAATEAFKAAIRKLEHLAKNSERMATVFANLDDVEFELAPSDTPTHTALGDFDCISGGAIINAVIYALARIPGMTGQTRIVEPDRAALSNLNRYMLLVHSNLEARKAQELASVCEGTGLKVEPINERYEQTNVSTFALANSVLVGVDDIPSRWLVQSANPEWLGIGATTHWSALASFHRLGLGCAECLHPIDDPNNAPIPTVAFVSFWAGLLTAAYFLQHLGENLRTAEQQIYLTPFRAENAVRSGVPQRAGCPTCNLLRAVGMRRPLDGADLVPTNTPDFNPSPFVHSANS